MAVVKVTESNFNEILDSGKTVLLDFYAEWCGPCKMVSPIVDQISEKNPDIIVGKIDVDDQQEIAEKYGIMSIPTLVVLKNGEVANKGTGVLPKGKLLEWLK